MRLCDINPFVRQSLMTGLNKNIKYDVQNRLRTVDCRLFYIISGEGEMIVENRAYALDPGTVILFKSGTEYLWNVNEIKFYSVNFDYTYNCSRIKRTFHPLHSDSFSENDILERIIFEDESALNEPIVLKNAPSVESRIRLMTTEYCMGGKSIDLLLSSILKSVIISIIRINSERSFSGSLKEPALVRNIIEYISANFSQNITNCKIAKEFHFNTSYINRIFKKHTGFALHDFLLNHRINQAMEMLRSQNIPVGEIANATGFESLAHFTKTFKKRVGKTPSEYRKN